MGMSPPCVDAVYHALKNELPKGAKVLSLGYSDILVPKEVLETDYGLKGLEVRPDSKDICAHHGLKPFDIVTCESFFKSLGASIYDVVDIKEWRGGEICLDLNVPLEHQSGIPLNPGGYDLILDLGTLEHCFNAPQALKTINSLLNINGVVVHWNPCCMPNHGFYNFSPTFFYDWYKNIGYFVKSLVLWNKSLETGAEEGVLIEPTKRFSMPMINSSLLTLVIKKEEKVVTWPTQTKYVNMGINEKS